MVDSKPYDYFKKIMAYCARSEKCRQDVVKKLTAYGAPEEDFESIIESLYDDNFLNDERYVKFYTSDKWRLDQWGRNKIKNGLFRKGFNEIQIEKGLKTIDEEEYKESMKGVLSKKRVTLQSEDLVEVMKKMISFGKTRGIEDEIIWQWLQQEGLSL